MRNLFSIYKIPLLLWLVFSTFTIIIFEFGPINFRVENKFTLYSYLLIAHISVIIGYNKGLRKSSSVIQEKVRSQFLNIKALRYIAVIVLVSLVINIIRDNMSGLSINNALTNSFESREAWKSERGGGFLGYIDAIFSALNIPFLALGFIFYKDSTKFIKRIFIFLMVYTLYSSFVGSSRHGLMMLLTTMMISVLASKFSNRISLSYKRMMLYAFVFGSIFLLYSSYIALSRNYKKIDNYSVYLSNNPNIDYSEDNFLNPNISGNLSVLNAGILQGYFYMSHGYSGLSKALELPFIGTSLIFGHSSFMIRNAARVFGEDFLNYSYFYRLINNNLHKGTQWVTAYTWIASDTTFIGSFFLLYFFGLLFAKSWVMVLRRATILTVCILAWMTYFFFQINIAFVPNDLGQFIGFWGCILIFTIRK